MRYIEFGFVADSHSGALGGAVYNSRNIKGCEENVYSLRGLKAYLRL